MAQINITLNTEILQGLFCKNGKDESAVVKHMVYYCF